jgi:excisionase family DNA binding protein
MTIDETAAELKCSPSTVRRRIADGSLPAFTDGTRLVRVRETDLRRYITERVDRRRRATASVAPTGVRVAPGARLWD